VRIVEVGLRDGLQSVPDPISTTDKVAVVENLIDAGVREIEVVSFAHPKVLPQLADAEEVMAHIPRVPGVRYRGLAPNIRGAQRAADTGLDELVALTCCDEKVSQINQGRGVEEVLAEIAPMAEVARTAGASLTVGIAMAFFATGRGPTPPDVPLSIARRVLGAGAQAVYLADTAGMADPAQVWRLVREAKTELAPAPVGVHLHTRNGMALANSLAALLAGADWIEGAFGGLGGDLWFPGPIEVLGNTPTEDLVSMLEAMGVSTGIDLSRYLPVVKKVSHLTGRPALSHTVRGGTRADLAAVDWDRVMKQSPYRTTTQQEER
jgi:hydroxymethylglutaryl-CoA lyase